jgi:hypothetical protein
MRAANDVISLSQAHDSILTSHCHYSADINAVAIHVQVLLHSMASSNPPLKINALEHDIEKVTVYNDRAAVTRRFQVDFKASCTCDGSFGVH